MQKLLAWLLQITVAMALSLSAAGEERPWTAKISRTDPNLHECVEFKNQKPMPWLKTRGTQIVDQQGEPIRLGGVAVLVPEAMQSGSHSISIQKNHSTSMLTR